MAGNLSEEKPASQISKQSDAVAFDRLGAVFKLVWQMWGSGIKNRNQVSRKEAGTYHVLQLSFSS